VLELVRVEGRAQEPVLDPVRPCLGKVDVRRRWERARDVAGNEGGSRPDLRCEIEIRFERLGHTRQDTGPGVKNASSV
jgi:hypothetical protein